MEGFKKLAVFIGWVLFNSVLTFIMTKGVKVVKDGLTGNPLVNISTQYVISGFCSSIVKGALLKLNGRLNSLKSFAYHVLNWLYIKSISGQIPRKLQQHKPLYLTNASSYNSLAKAVCCYGWNQPLNVGFSSVVNRTLSWKTLRVSPIGTHSALWNSLHFRIEILHPSVTVSNAIVLKSLKPCCGLSTYFRILHDSFVDYTGLSFWNEAFQAIDLLKFHEEIPPKSALLSLFITQKHTNISQANFVSLVRKAEMGQVASTFQQHILFIFQHIGHILMLHDPIVNLLFFLFQLKLPFMHSDVPNIPKPKNYKTTTCLVTTPNAQMMNPRHESSTIKLKAKSTSKLNNNIFPGIPIISKQIIMLQYHWTTNLKREPPFKPHCYTTILK
ncbi:hypothetical protein EGR_00399 [Echinococcus granulosus]|uniref:Uncharacterized protein n=1 Tax=Echinococcus granulosus TaxID=6210 RepID=W6UU15_ECHGR|nr:hypothetical protein EGR_00399 [Echinococcus granulosus]EUB65130.1 hypothetical protein EGR_00399 [Echinococcus granulosus]